MCNVGTIICSVIYVICIQWLCHMVDCSDVICGTYMCKHVPYKSITYLAYMAYMLILVGMFVSSTYLAIS